MSDTKKWKSRLLSSSIPLEYEVAKLLSELKFNVAFDYSYHRKDEGLKKEFSTDIEADFYFPVNNNDFYDARLTVLAECKYREEGKKWVFIPDINTPEASAFNLGYTIKSLSEFCLIKNNLNHIYTFESNFEFALKGVEVSLITGDVYDKDIRHGISQLKYALPYLIRRAIEGNMGFHTEDAKPEYIVSLLVTNADLYILDRNFSISRIKEVENIEELAKKGALFNLPFN